MYRTVPSGKSTCSRCQGHGCYWCRRRGYNVRCPKCGNVEPEGFTDNSGDFTCLVCGLEFDRAGKEIDPTDGDIDEPT